MFPGESSRKLTQQVATTGVIQLFLKNIVPVHLVALSLARAMQYIAPIHRGCPHGTQKHLIPDSFKAASGLHSHVKLAGRVH